MSGPIGIELAHESARAHVSGRARYIDDIPEVRGTLHAAPIISSVAHGELLGIDASEALAMPGVIGIVDHRDIPGGKMLATRSADEPIFAVNRVEHVGQVIGLVVADSMLTARRAAHRVKPDIRELPAILSIDEAIAQESFVLPTVTVVRGQPDAMLEKSPHQLHGAFSVGGQEHFYLEGQVAYALPQEQSQWLIHSSTQHPGEVQHWVAHALELGQHQVRIECRRMGGGFGGKETQAGQSAVWAALAAHKFAAPVKLRLDRDDDFMITGKRHPFHYRYTVGFDDNGRICALDLVMAVDCGFSVDLSGPVADRAIFHCDNAYCLDHLRVVSHRCRTNRQSHTAFRGFGGPQGMMLIETIMGDIGRHLGRDPLDVRCANLYSEGARAITHYGMQVEDNILAPLLARLEESSAYRQRRQDIDLWNQQSAVLRRGLAITPVKFGISFTATQFNQAGALVHAYTDGTVLVNHGGTEMGQGLHTKVCQIVASTLGLPMDRVRISASDTSKVANASATAASSGTDLNGKAAEIAAREIRQRLADFIATREGIDPAQVDFMDGELRWKTDGGQHALSFAEATHQAYAARVQLWSDGFYRTPKIHYDRTTLTGRPFFYFAYGAACTEVIIDTLTGEHRTCRVDILHDVGRSINPAIDIGQIEGGFIQGMGWLTSEELVWDSQGRLRTHAPSTYKIPTAGDTPEIFRVDLWPEPNREDSVYRSKAVGEPPLMLAISVWEALRDAVDSAVRGSTRPSFPVIMNAPATPEEVLRAIRPSDTPHDDR
jgi:xanthine dehydrogenase large subunit